MRLPSKRTKDNRWRKCHQIKHSEHPAQTNWGNWGNQLKFLIELLPHGSAAHGWASSFSPTAATFFYHGINKRNWDLLETVPFLATLKGTRFFPLTFSGEASPASNKGLGEYFGINVLGSEMRLGEVLLLHATQLLTESSNSPWHFINITCITASKEDQIKEKKICEPEYRYLKITQSE